MNGSPTISMSIYAPGVPMREIPEVTEKILSHLPSRDLFNISIVSRYLQEVAAPKLWIVVKHPIAQRTLHDMFARKDYMRLFQILAYVKEWVLPRQLFSQDTFFASSLPLNLLGFSHQDFRNPLQSLKVLHFSTAGVHASYKVEGPCRLPISMSLSNLQHLILDLNYVPPGANEYGFSQHIFNPQGDWWDPIGSVQPNHHTAQLVQKIAAVAGQLRKITLHGVLDAYTAGQLARIGGLEVLDLTNAMANGPGSLDTYCDLARMPNLLQLLLPVSLLPWASGASKPIQSPTLRSITMPKDEMDIHKILSAFHSPSVTSLSLRIHILFSPAELAKDLRQFRRLQDLHIDLHRWTLDASLGDVIKWIIEIPDLTSLSFFCYGDQWPSVMPTLDVEDATRISLAWSGLRLLHLGAVTFEFFQHILCHLPELAQLEVNASGWDSRWPAAVGPEQPALRSLLFTGRPVGWAADATSHHLAICCPGLQTIELAGCRHDEWEALLHSRPLAPDPEVANDVIEREVIRHIRNVRLERAQKKAPDRQRASTS
ncbi:hypothetical protein FIBSPDRAFT_902322 [Athelia psychrophila]|uniref:F-box domain-containing protein n=1 Tax=Athelia psychrophila TaxID=1759441 RepID=A0A167XD23_9AGAM|nr:hypothetical protein FIBSPDRAFT_902322 [Fibularhizoctonia sp. CBS 109695]